MDETYSAMVKDDKCTQDSGFKIVNIKMGLKTCGAGENLAGSRY